VIVAQISDLHVRRRGHVLHYMPNTADYLRRTISRLHALRSRPDLVIATGDLTERGSPHEYRRLRSILGRLEIPYFLIPGNHDDREALRRAFRDHRYLCTFEEHASFAIDAWPMRIIAMDSTQPGRSGGILDAQRLEWLRSELQAQPHRATILAMHHPPFRTGVAALDAGGFVNADELGRIVRAHRQIARLCAGHLHTTLMQPWNGTVACTAPSTSPQFVLGRSPLRVGIESAGFLLHEWSFNAEVHTYIVRLEGGVEQQIA
jgi:3',5'-cyclic-AMP phosphodiesterase